MKPDFRPYTEWEDYKAGMYGDAIASDRERLTGAAVALLADQHRLVAAMRSVTTEWRLAAEANLHELPNNRAWLGQAACCYVAGVPEELTRSAWGKLDDAERLAANRVADQVIDEWRYRTRRNPQRCLFDE
jgi:hypothetical protein